MTHTHTQIAYSLHTVRTKNQLLLHHNIHNQLYRLSSHSVSCLFPLSFFVFQLVLSSCLKLRQTQHRIHPGSESDRFWPLVRALGLTSEQLMGEAWRVFSGMPCLYGRNCTDRVAPTPPLVDRIHGTGASQLLAEHYTSLGGYGCGCQNRFGYHVGVGEATTHFRTTLVGTGMFTGGTGF